MTRKTAVISALVIVVVLYLAAVVHCNIEHNKKLGINGMNPCGSCWALKE